MMRRSLSGEELSASFSGEFVVGRLKGGSGSARVTAPQVLERMTREKSTSLVASTSVF